MPIGKGEEWGRTGSLAADALVVGSDAELAELVVAGHDSAVGLTNGDLARTLGGHGAIGRSTPTHIVAVDAVSVRLDDGSHHVAVAHVMLGHVRWHAHAVAIMNAAFLGVRNIAPRAHPGDGKADVVSFDLSLADRHKAWRRMPTGAHVPHPQIVSRQRRAGVLALPRRSRVSVDGRTVGVATEVGFEIIPAAIEVAVS